MIAARVHVWLTLCAAFALWLGTSTGVAHAQQSGKSRARAAASASAGKSEKRSKPARKAKRARADRKHPDSPARSAAPEAALPKSDSGSAEAPVPAAADKPTAESDKGDKPSSAQPQRAESEVDQADVRKENGTEVKTMEFSGLDIEGQLKTPQMLYFLNRLRAEFGRPRLPHRSFMPELQAGTQDEAMR